MDARDKAALDKENNPEILRMLIQLIAEDNAKLRREITKLEKEEFAARQQRLAIEDTLTILRRHYFGHGQEKRPTDPARARQQEDAQLLLHSQTFAPPPPEKETASLPSDVLEYNLTEEDLAGEAKERGYKQAEESAWKELKGMYDESKEITVVERIYKVVVHRRKKYIFEPSIGTDKEVIVTAPGPEKLMPGCHYSIDFAVSVVSDKYQDHLPLERQRRRMESLGLKGVSVKTLWNLCQATAVHMEPIIEGIKKEIKSVPRAVHCDETPWPINGSNDDNGYMWTISNAAGAYYQFEPTRSGAVIEEMLKGYEGPVMSDGYSGYNRLQKMKGIRIANCWSHARRKFYDIRENYPAECDEVLQFIDDLFAIERKAKEWDELKRLRKEESAPLIDKIRNWLFEKKVLHLPQSGFTKAVEYMLKHWPGLTAFLDDVRIPLSNNDVERAIRHGVMGRKNFYGSKTINGADVAAVLYTVIESCKRVELNPRQYMQYVIRKHHHGETALTPLEYAKSIRT
jgi:transposase